MSTTVVLVIGLGLILVGTAAVYGRRATTAKGNVPEPPSALGREERNEAAQEDAGRSGELVQPDEVVFVPLPNKQNQALVLGSESALAVFDQSGLTSREADRPGGPLPQLVRQVIGAGGAEATRRAQTGIESGRIVALAPETVEQLRRGKPVYDKAGSMLGLVRGDKGKLKHVMRLDQKGAQAVVASNAATLALTAALSQQLASIEKQLEQISSTLNRFVKDHDRKRIANIAGVNRSLVKVARSVQRRGEVTETDWQIVASLSESAETNSLEAAAKLDELAQQVTSGPIEGSVRSFSRSSSMRSRSPTGCRPWLSQTSP